MLRLLLCMASGHAWRLGNACMLQLLHCMALDCTARCITAVEGWVQNAWILGLACLSQVNLAEHWSLQQRVDAVHTAQSGHLQVP